MEYICILDCIIVVLGPQFLSYPLVPARVSVELTAVMWGPHCYFNADRDWDSGI